MNNKRPALGEQFLRSLLLSLAAMWIISHFFGWPGQKNNTPTATRPANISAKATLDNAFAGLNSPGSAAIDEAAAQKEITALQSQIAANNSDPYSFWARLRSGLLQQYVLKQPAAALKNYDEIIAHASPDAIDAQAIFQKGDWQWHVAESGKVPTNYAAPLPTKQDAVWTLENLIHRGRAASAYLETPIFVPKLSSGGGVNSGDANAGAASVAAPAVNAIPAQGFEKVKVGDLRGSLQEPHPLGILDRINAYYSTTWLNRSFDTLVNFFGGKPDYSYGLAIIVLAVLLRVLMQPINRRQYDSMKGMTTLQPETKKIQEKYKAKPTDTPEVQRDKQVKMLKEVQTLQKEHGVNPQMGCLLAFVQMPIFFYIINPLMMHYEPKMELVGATFGWFHLAHPDVVLLGLYGLSMLVSFRLSSTPPTDDMQRQMQIMTTFVMPIMLPFFMKGFSSAFILYWITYNVLSMIFQYRMVKAGDPTKSVWKTLVGDGLIPAPIAAGEAKATTEAVPPRPKEGGASKPVKASAKVKTLTPEKPAPANSNGNASNGHASNGNVANGKAQSTLDGSVDDSSEDSTQVSGTITVSQKNGNLKDGSNNGSASNGSASNGSPSSLNGSRTRRRRRF